MVRLLFRFVGGKDNEKTEKHGKLDKNLYLCGEKNKAMLNTTNTQGIYLNVPMTDWILLKELIRKFGWQAETREQLLDRFVKSRPKSPALSEEEIMEEVNAVRHQ